MSWTLTDGMSAAIATYVMLWLIGIVFNQDCDFDGGRVIPWKYWIPGMSVVLSILVWCIWMAMHKAYYP